MRQGDHAASFLVADVGGTKTLVGLFAHADGRPRPIDVRHYDTTDFTSFSPIVDAFARDVGHTLSVDAAVVGVAGPVIGGRAQLTNGTWGVDSAEISACAGTPRAAVINDLTAMAYSADVLSTAELHVLQEGIAKPDGNAAVIAAGTGLGQSCLHRVGGRLVPIASEAGHADFAVRTERESELLGMLRREYGRASVEHVLSGQGLVTLHRFTHTGRPCSAIRGDASSEVTPADVTRAALARTCPMCVEALDIFVSAYGAEAGNLALRTMATAGVFLGGGIAPKILPALEAGGFVAAFRDKAPMSDLLTTVPVRVILNPKAGLLGAAVFAQQLIDRDGV